MINWCAKTMSILNYLTITQPTTQGPGQAICLIKRQAPQIMRLHLQKLSKAVRPLHNGKRTDLSRRVDVAHIGSHTSDKGHDIVQRQGCDLGVELQKQRKRLANAAGSTYNADLHHVDDI